MLLLSFFSVYLTFVDFSLFLFIIIITVCLFPIHYHNQSLLVHCRTKAFPDVLHLSV